MLVSKFDGLAASFIKGYFLGRSCLMSLKLGLLDSKLTFGCIFPKRIYFMVDHVFSRVELIQLRRLCLIPNLIGRVMCLS
jgi:hypothetical protein